jgi:hypothetical protein
MRGNSSRCAYSEADRVYHRELIWRNAYELFKKRKVMTPRTIINMQKKYINSFNILSKNKNKYKSVLCLQQYFHTGENLKGLAEQTFLNTMVGKHVFTKS